jgi:hypothetical protein
MIHGDACFAYFNKIWGISYKDYGSSIYDEAISYSLNCKPT